MSPAPSRRVKDTIMREYPGVWDVSFSGDELGDVVTITAQPSATLCLIALSRLIASQYIPSYYTIDVRFEWKPGRFELMFGPITKGV